MQLDTANTIAALAAVVAALSAIASTVSAIASWKQVRLMRVELDKRERPYIYGYFHEIRRGLIGFVLENKGSVAALNVKTYFEEPAPTLHNDASINSVSVFSNTIAFFPPGESYSVPIGSGGKFLAEGAQTRFKLTLSYQTPAGLVVNDSISFDLDYMRNILSSPPTASEVLENMKGSLDKIRFVMELWRNEQLGPGVLAERGLGEEEGDQAPPRSE